jgi:hypothetical protein
MDQHFLPQPFDVYSQFGEDGLIEGIFLILQEKVILDKWCVEFGAWDGVYLSNTANLIKNKGWRAVLIEADKRRFQELTKNYLTERVTKINGFVTFDGLNTLDNLLKPTEIPTEFDFLSIDIDGLDYWVFESLKIYKPKVICIEFNPTIPNDVEFINPREPFVKQGSSALAILGLARSKGYVAVATFLCNIFLVDSRYAAAFFAPEPSLDQIHRSQFNNQIWIGYDGTIFLSQALNLLWHDIRIDSKQVQILPKFLRTFPEDYSTRQRLLFKLFKVFKFKGRD